MSTISSLATSKYLTDKHWEYRDGSQIKYIIPHHMAGKLSGAACAQYFVNNGLQNSANYCIGYGGDISCNVAEEYGAWTSSFSLADKYAITVEVSDIASGDWRIPDAAKEALIKLMVDLFKRYPSLGGKAIYDPTDEAEVVSAKRAYRTIKPKGNILLHVWTSAYTTSCPEWHMKQILPAICEEVNKRLSGGDTSDTYTVRKAAQKMIDDNINGQARKNWCAKYGLSYESVQAEIDLMLGKDTAKAIKELASSMPVVSRGSTGEAVAYLQTELKRMGYYSGDIDGQAGSYTVTAIKGLQTNWNKVYGSFAVDGSFGSQCWNRLLGA